jgi:RNA polymerase sigma-70 factor (ECF subfamily)
MGHEDAELIRRWQRGESAAFEALVRRWQQPLGRFLFRLVGREELVQDLCQEVFLRVYLARSRYKESGVFSSWLYRIALNVARDAGRRRRRQPDSLSGIELVGEDSTEAACERTELTQTVALALAELPEPLREVLVLRHYEEMSFEDISRLLRVPASTLKSRFTVALTRMRERLRAAGWSNEETP